MGLTNYIKETRGEMAHVSWPTRKQAIAYTFLVVVISIVVAMFLGFFDFSFSKLLGAILSTKQ